MAARSTLPLALLSALAVLAAGCVGTPEAAEPPVEAAAQGSLALPLTESIQGDVLVSAATPARTVNYGGVYAYTVTLAPNATGYVFELEWAAATPASQKLSVWVRPAGEGSLNDPVAALSAGEPLARVVGTSPLRLAMPIDQFPEPGADYDVIVRAAADPLGVAANQPFTLHVTAFDGVAFDEAFSALGAAEPA